MNKKATETFEQYVEGSIRADFELRTPSYECILEHRKVAKFFGIKEVIIKKTSELPKEYKLEDSIISQYLNTEFESLELALCGWLEFVINTFNCIKHIFEAKLSQSALPKKLLKIELNNLEAFFKSGVYDEIRAYHSELLTKELFEYYKTISWGDGQMPIGLGIDQLCLIQEVYEANDKVKKSNKIKSELFMDAMQSSLKVEWWLSIELQVMLWLTEWLEELNESQNFEEIFKKHKRQHNFDNFIKRKRGFQVNNPKIIPVLYKELTEHKLIQDNGLDNFKKAFQEGEGVIIWLGIKAQLGYFTKEIKKSGIILTHQNLKTAKGIFLVEGEHVNENNLKSGGSQISDKRKLIIDNLIKIISAQNK